MLNKLVSSQTLTRMLADVLIIAFSLIFTLVVRLLIVIYFQTDIAMAKTYFNKYIIIFSYNIAPLIIICLSVFYVNGFYTYGRWYQSRYKVFLISQATTLGFMLFAVFNYFMPSLIVLPRSVLFATWVLSLLFLIGARLWSAIWKKIVTSEVSRSSGIITKNTSTHDRKVVIIGGAGYIGSALLPMMLDSGYNVRLVDLFFFGEQPIAKYLNHPNLEIVRADFRRIDKMVEIMNNQETVIHLGGIVGDPACSLNEDLTLEVNLLANRMLAEVAKGIPVKRFIFASSCSVYGHGDELLDERSQLNPLSLYAKTKLASEKAILNVFKNSDVAPVFLRFGTIYGFSGRIRFDLVVNLLTAKAYKEGVITIFNGDQWRPFVHVEDAARAIMLCLEAPRSLINRQAFNVGSEKQNYTISQVGNIIKGILPDADIVETPTDGDRRDYRVKFDKIQKTLDYKAQWNLEDGIRQVIGYLEDGKIDDFNSFMYSNYKFFSEKGDLVMHIDGNNWVKELLVN